VSQLQWIAFGRIDGELRLLRNKLFDKEKNESLVYRFYRNMQFPFCLSEIIITKLLISERRSGRFSPSLRNEFLKLMGWRGTSANLEARMKNSSSENAV
jgi:hypothetical protein